MSAEGSLPVAGRMLILSFAFFTVACHLTVLTGGGLTRLWLLAAVSIAIGIGLSLRTRRRRSHGNPRIASQEVLVLIVLVAAIGITLTAHRPDEDDSLYISFSTAAVDDPTAAILHRPTLHDLQDSRYFLPNHKVHSLEMLVAAVAVITGLEPIVLFHLVLAPVAALLAVLAVAVLFRRLVPDRYGLATLSWAVFLVAMGDVHQSYGNFAFVRLHQGKGILVTALVPVLVLFGLEFAGRPGRRTWIDLAAAQIAAIGLTANGLLVAPAVAGLAVVAGLVARRSRRWPGVLFAASVASAYPLLTGSLVSRKLQGVFASPLMEVEPASQLTAVGSFLFAKLAAVFGTGSFAWLCLIVVASAWWWVDRGESRAICLVYPLGLGLVFLNPLLAPVLARYLIGGQLYWRVMWVLPFGIISGLATAGLAATLARSRLRRLGAPIVVLALAVMLLLPETTTLSADNRTRLGRPGLKVPTHFDVALAVRRHCEERSNVAVPWLVAPWLPTLEGHPYPVISRPLYGFTLGEEATERTELTHLVSGRKVPRQVWERLGRDLARLRVSCVVFPARNRGALRLRERLSSLHFVPLTTVEGFEIWTAGGLFGDGFESGEASRWFSAVETTASSGGRS